MKMLVRLLTGLWLGWSCTAAAAVVAGYQQPDARLAALVEQQTLPQTLLSADEQWLSLAYPAARPEVQTLATELQQSRGLAGLLIDEKRLLQAPKQRIGRYLLQQPAGQIRWHIQAEPDHFLMAGRFSPDSRFFSYLEVNAEAVLLRLVELASGQVRRYPAPLNAVLGPQYQWQPDSQGLLLLQASADNQAVFASKAPLSPLLQQSSSTATPSRTVQLLLQHQADAERFLRLITAPLFALDLQLKARQLSVAQPIVDFQLSPDQQYLLLETLPPPYSYQLPMAKFNRSFAVLRRADGQLLPVGERQHSGAGIRQVHWHPLQAASLYWQQTRRTKTSDVSTQPQLSLHRLVAASALPGADTQLLQLEGQLQHWYWAEDGQALLLLKQRKQQLAYWWRPEVAATLAEPAAALRLWYRLPASAQSPGDIRLSSAGNGLPLLRHRSGIIFRRQIPQQQQQWWRYQADAPLSAQQPELLWQSQPQYREQLLHLSQDGSLLLKRQSPRQPPSLIWRQAKAAAPVEQVLAQMPALATALAQLRVEQVSFQRADGVRLSGRLYLPADFRRSQGPLPTLIWAYPREYDSQQQLDEARVHPLDYPVFNASSAAAMAVAGFAVFDKVSMPILASNKKQANDQYLPQLVANAEAAVAVLERLGVAKRGNIAIGGHSYGAFMVANLLAHTDLFAAGIARSGAYNRTLTPFGFQSEQRHLWQQPELYLSMSPYLAATKIKAPLLLIHGSHDQNSGTRPLQSELMYQALQGLGRVSRLVILPAEGHHYQARQSLLHLLWEQQQWLQQHLQATDRSEVVVERR